MVSAKDKMLKVLKKNVGKIISSSLLRKASGNISDWARQLRQAKQEGWDIEYKNKEKGYILKSTDKGKGKEREYVSTKLKVLVLKNYGYKCAYCGKNPREDGIKLAIDHKIPVEFGGPTEFNNLQPLCEGCNHGKKSFFRDEDPEMLKKIFSASSDEARLKIFFDYHLGLDIPVQKIVPFVSGREWMRSLRRLREKGYQVQYSRAKDSYTVTR